jgi:predicted kinase
MKKLIIIRGPSGSGKTTIAASIGRHQDYSVSWHEADDFFVGEDGEYHFNPQYLGQAHKSCQDSVRVEMCYERSIIVVSNTSMKRWEMNPYLQLAREFDYDIEVIRTPGPWNAQESFERNLHGVPLTTIEKQIAKYEPYEGEFEWPDITYERREQE